MERILDWITKHKKITITIFMILIILPMAIIHLLFKWKSNCYWIESEWSAGDVLGYFGEVLSFVGTVVLGYIAITQTEKANQLNKQLLDIEKNKIKPYFDFVPSQLYKIFLDEAMREELSKIQKDDIVANVLYPYTPRTGTETNSALIKLEVTNTGTTNISRMYIKTKLFYLSVRVPNNSQEQKLSFFISDTHLNAGEKKFLYIVVKREFATNEEFKCNYYVEHIDQLMPHIELELTLETITGDRYKEKISFGSNWDNSMKNENNIATRSIGIIDIDVSEINE